MIFCENMSGGRFGNDILFYNNLRQIARTLCSPWYCNPWNDFNIFEKPSPIKNESIVGKSIKLNSKNLLNTTLEELRNLAHENDIILSQPCLGELFFKFSFFDPNDYFLIKKEPKTIDENIVGIHFRGTDFKQWNSFAILPTDYYIDAINFVLQGQKNVIFKIFTDDFSLKSINDVLSYCKEKNIKHKVCTNLRDRHYVYDFVELAMRDSIISSPSTFCICAGFLGTKKKIIHSEKWVNDRYEKNDTIWCHIKNGGNQYYDVWKLI